jgi:hypothetical protein
VGDQTIISKFLKHQPAATSTSGTSANGSQNTNRVFDTLGETRVPASVANDHGVSTWFGVSPSPQVDFQIGYSRSMHYDFNSLFFGVGFRLGK